MIPAVRSLISIPAGMSRMPFGKFMTYSALGTILWTTFLAYLGYHFSENQALMTLIMQRVGYIILALALLYIIWIIARRFKKIIKINTETYFQLFLSETNYET